MLWFAFKLISLSYWIQQNRSAKYGATVVICFQTYIFVILNTAESKWKQPEAELWFAFKLISLSYWIQRLPLPPPVLHRCDLLSNLYLCHIEYSANGSRFIDRIVVICFQTYIFVILNTATFPFDLQSKQLWFAFKLISLSYWIQLTLSTLNQVNRCDLLSNLYLCHIEYSGHNLNTPYLMVVICFQTYIFVILNTALKTV